MAVKIRLRRTGRKKQPSYRLVVAESTAPRDGQYLDAVGTYNPLVKPADLRIDLEKVDQWLADGAQMTDTVASLIRKARNGGDRTVAVRGVGPDEKPAPAVVDAPSQAEPPRAGSRGAAAPVAPVAPQAEVEAPAEEAVAEVAAPAGEAEVEAPAGEAEVEAEAAAPAGEAVAEAEVEAPAEEAEAESPAAESDTRA